MPAGLTIFNDNGFLTIDSTWSNMGLRQKSIINTIGRSPTDHGPFRQTATLSFTAVSPMVFTRCDYFNTLMISRKTGTNQWFVEIGVEATSSVPVTIYVFDVTGGMPATQSAGLNVFDEAGNLVFDANSKTFIVTDFLSIGANPPTQNFTWRPGRLYAAAVTAPITSRRFVPMTPPLNVYYYLGHRNIASGIQTANVETGQMNAPTQANNEYWAPGNIIVADVTNY